MGKRRRRRSRYQRFSESVFRVTGLPLMRFVQLTAGLIAIIGIVLFLLKDIRERENDSESVLNPELTNSLFDTEIPDEQSFLLSATIPSNFDDLPLPVRIERIDKKIANCQHLLTQETDYKETIYNRMISLFALRCTSVAQEGVDPRPMADEMYLQIANFADTDEKRKQMVYLKVFVSLTILSFDPKSSFYNDALQQIGEIDETTSVPPPKALGCYNAALRYYIAAGDKEKAAILLKALGRKLALAEVVRLSDLGLALIDYPQYFALYKEGRQTFQSEEDYSKQAYLLFEQLGDAPPQSAQTYDRLLSVPELFLKTGNIEAAKQTLLKIKTVAATANQRIKSYVDEKVTRSIRRLQLPGNSFQPTGTQTNGSSIPAMGKEKTLILFWDPDDADANQTLKRIRDSSLNTPKTTEIVLVPVSELTPEELIAMQKQYPDFKVADAPTSKSWIQRCGINDVPYLLTIDADKIVRRLGKP
jgi:tetratricopeptide (TPR) repeat protein